MLKDDELRKKLNEYIAEHNLTRVEMANRIGCSTVSLDRFISGRYPIREDTRIYMHKALGLDLGMEMVHITPKIIKWKENILKIANMSNTSVLQIENAAEAGNGFMKAMGCNPNLKIIPKDYIEKICAVLHRDFEWLSRNISPEDMSDLSMQVRNDKAIHHHINKTYLEKKARIEKNKPKTGYIISPSLCKECEYGNRKTSSASIGYCLFWDKTGKTKRRGATYHSCPEFVQRQKRRKKSESESK